MQDMPQSQRTEENVSKDWLWILATEIFEIKIRVNATFIHRDPKHYLMSQGGYVRRSTGQEENVKIYFMCYLSHTEKKRTISNTENQTHTESSLSLHVCVTFPIRGISQKKWEGHDSECLFIESTLISSHNRSFSSSSWPIQRIHGFKGYNVVQL